MIWLCQCDCGTIKTVLNTALTNGLTISCGCYHKEHATEFAKTHGFYYHPLYTIWKNMMDRCYNKKCKAYKYYGGRGINVCKRWHDIKNFVEDLIGRPGKLTLDRIDNNGNYEPNNCRWVSQKIQCNNTRANRKITFSNLTLTLSEWSEKTNINRDTIRHRLYRYNWTVEDALTTLPTK